MNEETEVLGADFKKFISRDIDSVATLETLLFFRKKKDKEWSVGQIASELRSGPIAIEARVAHLIKRGFLQKGESEDSYRYAPSSKSLEELVDKLAQLYPRYQIRIIDLIYSPAKTTIQEFADAFKLKRDGDDNG